MIYTIYINQIQTTVAKGAPVVCSTSSQFSDFHLDIRQTALDSRPINLKPDTWIMWMTEFYSASLVADNGNLKN